MGNEASSQAGITTDTRAIEEKRNSISKNDTMIRNNVRPKLCYPMKIVLRGSRKTGKTSLFKRLQGDTFNANYMQTPEIQVASIHWEMKAADDFSKIDVWDCVDDGYLLEPLELLGNNQRCSQSGMTAGKHRYQPLDTKAVDVYKDSHVVIFLINPFSRQSLDYVRKSYTEVSMNICILLVLNFKDLVYNFVSDDESKEVLQLEVTKDQVLSLADEIRNHRMHEYKMDSSIANSTESFSASSRLSSRTKFDNIASSMECGAAFVLETSMADCYGLRDLHNVSNIVLVYILIILFYTLCLL